MGLNKRKSPCSKWCVYFENDLSRAYRKVYSTRRNRILLLVNKKRKIRHFPRQPANWARSFILPCQKKHCQKHLKGRDFTMP